MKIYFGKSDDTITFGTDGLLEHDGDYYSGVVEFGSNPGGIEDVLIQDGCGRRIPVSVDHLFELCTILSEFSNIRGEIARGQEMQEYVESDEAAVTCANGHIHY